MADSPGSGPTNWRRSLRAPSDSAERNERQRGLLYGRRKGPKLSAHQAALCESLLPRIDLELHAGLDPTNCFDAPVADTWLEIGFGAGEHLLWQAQHRPEIGLIGVEPYQACVAKLLSKLHPPSPTLPAEEETRWNYLSRIRIHQGDARDVIEALPDASLGRVFLLFPDPWPKKRHHKRRFVQSDMLDRLARAMRPGAELRFASDDPGYIEWTLERVSAHPAFEWAATCANDWKFRPPDWPPTRYEQKALHGAPVFLRFRRRMVNLAAALQTGVLERT